MPPAPASSSPPSSLQKLVLADLLTLVAIHEWTIANQPQRALAQLALVRAELRRREKLGRNSELETYHPA